jgi:septal ring factor EnvC (AmiA/AmiB activator)
MDKETLKQETKQRLEGLHKRLHKSETRLATIDNNIIELHELLAKLKEAVNNQAEVPDTH